MIGQSDFFHFAPLRVEVFCFSMKNKDQSLRVRSNRVVSFFCDWSNLGRASPSKSGKANTAEQAQESGQGPGDFPPPLA